MDSTTDNSSITIKQLGSLNERKLYNNPDPGQLDVLRNAIPTLAGSLSRMNGIKYLSAIAGEEIIGFCQTNDSRQNILVQTRTKVYQYTSAEFWNQVAYVPVLSYTAFSEEETMPIAIIVHQVANTVSSGTMANNTNWQTAPLSAILSQVNADGTAAAFVTLAANQMTIQAGVYRIRGWSKGSVAALTTRLRSRLQNITSAVPAWNGLANENSDEGLLNVANRNLKMEFGGILNLAGPTIFEVQNRASVGTNSSDFGTPASDGNKEIYRWIEILKSA